MLGDRVLALQGLYCAAKHAAVKGATDAFRMEFEMAGLPISVTLVKPGPVDTPLLEELFRDPERRARRMVHIPFGRLAKPSEIAHAALRAAGVPLTLYTVLGAEHGGFTDPRVPELTGAFLEQHLGR